MSQSESEQAGSRANDPGPRGGSWGRLNDRALPRTVRRSLRSAGIEPMRIGRHTQPALGTHYVLRGVDVFSRQRIMGRRREASMVITDMYAGIVARQHGKFFPPAL